VTYGKIRCFGGSQARCCSRASEDWSFDIEELFDAGDQVVTFVRHHGKGKHGGPEVEMRFAQVWTFRDGLGARMELYAGRNEALEAAGLSV
jgi:ketosteroid isomerase-like protein